jgi:hypothetical protein
MLSEKFILSAKNLDVNVINFQIRNKITGELMTYRLIDTVTNHDDIDYPTKFLNSLGLPGLPLFIILLLCDNCWT